MLLIAGVAMLGMAGAANAQPVREVDCVYAQLVSNKAYALVGRTYLSDSEPADDVATAMLQLSDAVRACSEWSNLTSGQKAAMTDIGLYRSAIDYLGDELKAKGATQAAVKSLDTILAPFSAADIDRFYEADWRSDLAFMGRVQRVLAERGVPGDEMSMELGFQIAELAAKRAQSEYLFSIGTGAGD